jgi:cytochrome P450
MSACPCSTEALSKDETFVGGAPLELLRSIRSDQPVLMKYRRIVKNAFTPRRIDALEARFAEIFGQTAVLRWLAGALWSILPRLTETSPPAR